jgi:hypothetical protein
MLGLLTLISIVAHEDCLIEAKTTNRNSYSSSQFGFFTYGLHLIQFCQLYFIDICLTLSKLNIDVIICSDWTF